MDPMKDLRVFLIHVSGMFPYVNRRLFQDLFRRNALTRLTVESDRDFFIELRGSPLLHLGSLICPSFQMMGCSSTLP